MFITMKKMSHPSIGKCLFGKKTSEWKPGLKFRVEAGRCFSCFVHVGPNPLIYVTVVLKWSDHWSPVPSRYCSRNQSTAEFHGWFWSWRGWSGSCSRVCLCRGDHSEQRRLRLSVGSGRGDAEPAVESSPRRLVRRTGAQTGLQGEQSSSSRSRAPKGHLLQRWKREAEAFPV